MICGGCKVLVAEQDVVWMVALALLAHVQAVESRPWSMKWLRSRKRKDRDYELENKVMERVYRKKDKVDGVECWTSGLGLVG